MPQAGRRGEALRYQRVGRRRRRENCGSELLTVKLRYKQPEGDTSTLIEVPVDDPLAPVAECGSAGESPRPADSRDFEWAAAVAAFGMVLRDSQFRGQAGFDLVLELAQGAKGKTRADAGRNSSILSSRRSRFARIWRFLPAGPSTP